MTKPERPTIPFVDLGEMHHDLTDAILDAWRAQIGRSGFVGGPEVEGFEREFAAFVGGGVCVGLSSGTAALHLALVAAGIGPDDEVITVPHTFIATVEAISQTGARAVFVDVDREHGLIDPVDVEAAITPRTRAVVPVHLYGQIADMTAILDIARRHDLRVIEDAAQAHGASLDSQRAGTFGDAAAFSFYPSKNLGALGDGGALVTAHDELADRVRLMRDHGQAQKNVHTIEGSTARLHTLQAAALRIKLPRLDGWNAARREAARAYDDALQGTGLELPSTAAGREHVYHLYVVRHPDRDAIAKHLAAANIETGQHYPTPLHLQPAYSAMGHGPGAFPEAERWAARCLSLPMFPGLDAGQVQRVAETIRELHLAPADG